MPDMPAAPLLLDTHVWIWVMEGRTDEVPSTVLDAVERAQTDGRVWVSAISVWEVGMLEAKGRLTLSRGIQDWVRRALGVPGVRLAELSPEVALDSSSLPGTVHGDPADRILIATARDLGATLVTRDRSIISYGEQGLLAVLDASP
ncbi:MAG TPA: type II toxin-antitoxin system VapC family toxin [Longimicrobium sp.]|jgi:PIN domain nuclease of toxin-antitoxin system